MIQFNKIELIRIPLYGYLTLSDLEEQILVGDLYSTVVSFEYQ